MSKREMEKDEIVITVTAVIIIGGIFAYVMATLGGGVD